MHFSKTLMAVADNTMSMCSDALDEAFKAGKSVENVGVHSYALRDGMVMRVRFEVEIVKPEDG